MPAVKKFHQSLQNNSKPAYIFGHSFQALGVLVCARLGQLCCVPLTRRIHEGVVFTNRDRRTLLDKFALLFLDLVSHINAPTVLIVDAYHRYVQLGGIAQGLLQHLALYLRRDV